MIGERGVVGRSREAGLGCVRIVLHHIISTITCTTHMHYQRYPPIYYLLCYIYLLLLANYFPSWDVPSKVFCETKRSLNPYPTHQQDILGHSKQTITGQDMMWILQSCLSFPSFPGCLNSCGGTTPSHYLDGGYSEPAIFKSFSPRKSSFTFQPILLFGLHISPSNVFEVKKEGKKGKLRN